MTLVYRHAPGVLSREVGDSTFLSLDADGALFRLNPMGAAVWRTIATPQSLDDIVALFVEAFPDRPRAALEADVMGLIEDLRRRDLIVTADTRES